MGDIFRVFKFEFLKEVKSRAFLVASLVIFIIILAMAIFTNFIIKSDMREAQEGPDAVGVVSQSIGEDVVSQIYEDYIIYSSEGEVKEALEEDLIDYGLVFYDIDDVKFIVNTVNISKYDFYTEPIRDYLLDQDLAQRDLSLAKIQELKEGIVIDQTFEAKQETNFFVIGTSFIFVIILYIMIIGSGQTVASAVASEKSDRTMEILLVSTRLDALIHGKVLASLASSLIQIFLMGLALVIGFIINLDLIILSSAPDMAGEISNMDPASMVAMASSMNTSFNPGMVLFLILFFINGYFLYTYIYAALGASVAKSEDLGTAVTPISIMSMLIYLASLMSMGNPDGAVMRFLSYFPFSSPFVAVARYEMTDMPFTGLVASYLILLVTSLVFVRLSVKLYRMTSLNYGNTSLRSQLRALFSRQ